MRFVTSLRKICRSLTKPIIDPLREKYYKNLRKRLSISSSPSIIASDCVGGVISHNLGLKFCSPTINLYFSKEDFILFCENLRGFLTSELTEFVDPDLTFPVGILKYNDTCIKINFLHYSSFEEAKEKWDERKERVDYSNIVIIWVIPDQLTEKDIRRFDSLPYKRKLLISYDNITNSENVVINRVFKKKNFYPGKIMSYPSIFSTKKYLDEIDYVDLLNSEP